MAIKRRAPTPPHFWGRLNPYAIGHALGLMSVLVLVFYGLFVWFGTYDPTFISVKYPLSFSFYDWTFLFGLVETYVMGYVLGLVFSRFYNSVL